LQRSKARTMSQIKLKNAGPAAAPQQRDRHPEYLSYNAAAQGEGGR